MEAREIMDVFHLMLDVLFFRNARLCEGTAIMIRERHLLAAKVLLRALYEGTITFEWCMVDPQARALRFRRTSFEGTLELIREGYLRRPDEYEQVLAKSVQWLDKNGYRRIPNVRQMAESIDVFQPGQAYKAYKYLSKVTHAGIENWGEVFNPAQRRIRRPRDASEREVCSLSALFAFLQMRNIRLVGEFDPGLRSDSIGDLQARWDELWPALNLFERAQ